MFRIQFIYLSPPSITATSVQGSTHYRSFTIILRHTISGRTPLDEWSTRHRYLYI